MSHTITFPSKRLSKLTTPQLLKGGLGLSWGASLLLLLVTISGVQEQQQAIKTIGKDSVPSILVAQRIKDALAGMDANAVNELLAPPGKNQDAVKAYEERRQVLADRLVSAAENITYGEAERKPIQTLQRVLGEYIAKLQQARDFHQRGDATGVLTAYREAAKIMDEKLLPAADALDKANLDILERIYEQERFASARSLFLVIISGLILIGVLAVIQLFLYYRMRRILNFMLLAATAILILFLGETTQAFLSSAHNLKVAKEDAFDSMHDLRQARALSYSANADESRYLLDTALASTHDQAFFNKVNKIAELPRGETFEAVIAASAKGAKVNGLKGLLGEELNNITFPGEREAAVANLSKLGDYVAIDKQIRQLQQSGRHQEAIALCVGNQPKQSNWAFDQLLKANQNAFDINDKAFNDAIAQASKELNAFESATPVVAIFVASLTLFGLLPRLKEYS